jgi:hypothetical protein
MASQPIFGIRAKRSLAYAIAVVALCTVLESSARAQTTWNVTIDVTGGGDVPTYDIRPQPTTAKCQFSSEQPAQGKPGDVFVCGNDTVNWQVKTKQGHGQFIVCDLDGVIAPYGKRPNCFRRQAGDTPAGGTVDSSQGGTSHKYVVAVFDPDNNPTIYVHDPQIVIGK